MNGYAFAAANLRAGFDQKYALKAQQMRSNNTNLPLLDVLDWKKDHSEKTADSSLQSQLQSASNTDSYGSAHARNAIYWLSGTKVPEILIYPNSTQKRLKSESLVPLNSDSTLSTYFQIMPNPANDRVTLLYRFEIQGQREVLIYNRNGQLVQSLMVSDAEGKVELNTSNWAEGLYLVKVPNEEKLLRLIITN